MATPLRVEKINAAILKALGEIIQQHIHDSRVRDHFGSVTQVTITRDLRHAKVHLSVFGDAEAKQAFMEGIHSAQGFIRSELGRQVRLRFIPELHFVLDKSIEDGSQVIALLDQMRARGDL
jgi:ribosome-binding factor A